MDDDVENWDELPQFAKLSPTNVWLFQKIKDVERELRDVSAENEDTSARETVMMDHLRNVQTELLHTQQLLDAKRRELESEDHLKKLAQRESGRVRAEFAKMDREAQDKHDAINVIQNAIFKGNEKLDKYNLQLTISREELEQWALAAKQKEEDNQALARYHAVDNVKIKAMSLELEKLTEKVQQKKKALEEEVTDTQSAQIELDKAAEDFRQLHRERTDLLAQWDEAIQAMQRRDEAIRAAGEKFAENKQTLRALQEAVAENKKFFDDQVQANKEMEAESTKHDRTIAKYRQEFGDGRLRLVEFQDEVDVMRGTVAKAEGDLAAKKRDVDTLGGMLVDHHKKLVRHKKHFDTKKRALTDVVEHTGHLEVQAREVDNLFKAQEQSHVQKEKEIERLKVETFKFSQEMFKERQSEANMMMEITGAHAAVKNLMATINSLDSKSLKQQELLYQQDFHIQQMERKVARASGERTNEEKKVLNAKITELQKQLQEQSELHTHLSNQLKRLADDVRKKQRELVQQRELKVQTAEKINELMLEADSVERSLKAITRHKEEMMVNRNEMKLELKRLREILNERADEVYQIRNRNEQLKLAAEEREKQIVAHRDMLRAQLRLLEQERSKVAAELNERLQKCEKLEAKFTVVDARLNGDTEGEQVSQTYHVIKAAQEKEELIRQGDELNTNIEKIEREIRNMETMLKGMKVRNETARKSSHLVDANAPELSEKSQLEQKLMKARERLRRKKIQRDSSQAGLDSLMKTQRELTNDLSEIERQTQRLEATQGGLQVENRTTEQVIQVEQRKLDAEAASCRASNFPNLLAYEREFYLEKLKTWTQWGLHNLTSFVTNFPDMKPLYEKLCQAEQIPSDADALSRPESAASARSAASRSSRASSVRSSGGMAGRGKGVTPRTMELNL
eukprot:TRINITY_DN15185_c0_g1_i1.p1 TRINITY_DN15185_c0_g1~~TRINITY_DN15185_c0_g1_i1.p1  ORF type:complete len:936 (-),score=307.22 TRINITY_DN15185_c0_g1_i1:68-2806(-)